MARIARVVAPNIPHHITQRGNRRQQVFFKDQDYQTYLELIARFCGRNGVEVWAYCLMPNHVHLIAVPERADSLRKAIGEAHRRYTRYINFRERWRGHLWQERFASFPMDENHLLAAARYVELNPVRAKLVRRPGQYTWSSASAHLRGQDDILVKTGPLLEIGGDWQTFLSGGISENKAEKLRTHERTGRPLGDDSFVLSLEALLGRTLRRKKPGPKKKAK